MNEPLSRGMEAVMKWLPLAVLTVTGNFAGAQLETKVLPVNGFAYEEFGCSVSLCGTRALIGAWRDNSGSGAAYVHELEGGVWVRRAQLAAHDSVMGDWFGVSTSLDGDRALIGAYGGEAAYVFDLKGGTWQETAKLEDPTASIFGLGVALDGDYALVGSSESAFMFELQNGTWTQVAKLTGDDPCCTQFGRAVALSGEYAAIGAYFDSDNQVHSGAVYVYERQGGLWTHVVKLYQASPVQQDHFGEAVDLDENHLLVGAGHSNGDPGGAHLFVRQNGIWNEIVELFPGDGASFQFGSSVSISGDRAVVGAFGDNDTGFFSGAAYVYDLSAGTPVQIAKLRSSDLESKDELGYSVALDGDLALIGAPGDNESAQLLNAGAAYVFDLSCGGPATAYCSGKVTSGPGCHPYVACSGGPPGAASPDPFVVEARDVLNNKPGVLFYGSTGRAALPWQGGLLCILPPLMRTRPQTSGGNLPADDCSGSYTFDVTSWLQSGVDPALAPGVLMHAQYWFRDADDPFGAGLSNAIEWTIE